MTRRPPSASAGSRRRHERKEERGKRRLSSLLIFLDFDRVLRREDAPLSRFEKPLCAAFETAVRRIPKAEIVVT